MNRRRLWWAAAIVIAVVLWAAVLAIPAVALLLSDQWQGNSPVVPPGRFVLQWLSYLSAPLATTALVMTTSLVVIGAAHGAPRARRRPEETEADADRAWAEGEVEDQELLRRR